MDAPCEIQGSIHVFRLVNNMCPGKWVHINWCLFFIYESILGHTYSIILLRYTMFIIRNKPYTAFLEALHLVEILS